MSAFDAAPSSSPASTSSESSSESESSDSTLDLEQSQEQTQQPTAKQIAKMKSFKYKYNGKEMDETLPFEVDDTPENRDYLTRQAQMARLSTAKAQEAATLERDVRAFIDELRKNPRKALSNPHIGIDIKNLAKEILEEEITNSQKTPEQLKIEEYEAKLKDLEDDRKTKEEEQRTREYDRLVEQEYERYDTLMSNALDSSDLPKSPYVVKKMTDYMIMGLNEGMDISPADVLPIVREEIMNDIKEMFGAMPLEVMEQIIGGENLTKLRKNRLAGAKKGPTNPLKQIQDVKKPTGEKKPDGDKQTFKDFFKI